MLPLDPGHLEALRRTYGYETVVYAANVSGRGLVNGIPFCQIRSRLTGRRLVSLPFSDHCQPLVDNPEEVHELLALHTPSLPLRTILLAREPNTVPVKLSSYRVIV